MRLLDGFAPTAAAIGTTPDVPELSDDAQAAVKGFASATAVAPGESVDFHISVPSRGDHCRDLPRRRL